MADNDRKHYDDKPDIEKPKEEQPGYLAGLYILKELKTIAKSRKLIEVPGITKPDTWDVADAIYIDNWTPEQVLAYISDNLKDPPEPPSEQKDELPPAPFRCLGHDGDYRYYLTTTTQRVKAIGENSHTAIAILNLAPIEFWRTLFPSKGGVDWLATASFLLNHPDAARAFDPRKRRGRGAGIDNKRIIYHFGDRLLVDNKISNSLEVPDSDFIYERGVTLKDDITKPLSDEGTTKFLELISKLNCSSGTQNLILAGFIALAPICGALEWRPHIWLTGGKGTGKSTVFEKILVPCIGNFSHFVTLDTTAPGLRQAMKFDAVPVIFDESEGQDIKSKINIQDVLKLARQSSSGNGARVIKGSSSHKAIDFDLRSMFVFASIGVNITEGADESRISIVEMVINTRINQNKRNEQWAELENEINNLLTDEFRSSLRVRSILNISTIRQNCRTFSIAISENLNNKRAGDQLGALFAGWYSLISLRTVTLDEARNIVKNYNFETIYTKSAEDEAKLLDFILQQTLRINPTTELSIDEIIRKITARPDTFDGSFTEAQVEYYNLLKRKGIRIEHVKSDRTRWIMWIANNHTGIKEMLNNTQWPQKWGLMLKRIPGALNIKAMRFTGIPYSTPATGIPLDDFLKDEND